ncbi:hypothetical protein [Candidatus Spongiihabitans sp.]
MTIIYHWHLKESLTLRFTIVSPNPSLPGLFRAIQLLNRSA